MGQQTAGEVGGFEKAMGAVGSFLPVAGGVASIIQGIDARKEAKDAERAAAEAMDQARKKAEVNYLEALRVPTETYERAYRNAMARSGQATEALKESDPRALAGGIGKVQGVMTDAESQIRDSLADRIYNQQMAAAGEEGKIRDTLTALSLGEAMGVQEAASDLYDAGGKSISSGIKGLGGSLENFLKMAGLYGKDKEEDETD